MEMAFPSKRFSSHDSIAESRPRGFLVSRTKRPGNSAAKEPKTPQRGTEARLAKHRQTRKVVPGHDSHSLGRLARLAMLRYELEPSPYQTYGPKCHRRSNLSRKAFAA